MVTFPHHTSPTYPAVKSLTDWDKVRSSKVDTLVTLLAWELESDNHYIFHVKDDDTNTEAGESAKVPSPPPAPKEKDASPELQETPKPNILKPNVRYAEMTDLMTRGTRKILVYIEFPMMAPLLVSVLKLFNIIPLVIHGGHGIEECNETVQRFHTDLKARILIFSSIGAIGLNLNVASIVILFMRPMLVSHVGQSDYWQKEVIVYNMVALGTMDVLMVDHGEGKGNMLGQFLAVNKGVVKMFKNTAAGQLAIPEDNDDEVEITETCTAAAKSSKPRKNVAKGSKKCITRNIAQTGDEDGEFIDINSMVLEDDDDEEEEDEEARESGQGKMKAKPKVLPLGRGAMAASTNMQTTSSPQREPPPATASPTDATQSNSRTADKIVLGDEADPLPEAHSQGELHVDLAKASSPTMHDVVPPMSGIGSLREPLIDTGSTVDTAPADKVSVIPQSAGPHREPMLETLSHQVKSTKSGAEQPGQLSHGSSVQQPQPDRAQGTSDVQHNAPSGGATITADHQGMQSAKGTNMDIDTPSTGPHMFIEMSMPEAEGMDLNDFNDFDNFDGGDDGFHGPDDNVDIQMDAGSTQCSTQASFL
ncbi:hypothetical protein EDB19DRAFT_1825600 [Suillus lakei]|nr:hypothetical protein EDB19DRAFT_1825600 [Suillus lakei]